MPLLTVAGRVDVIGQLRHRDLEPRLDRLQHLLVALGRHKGDGQTLGAETASTTVYLVNT